MSALASLALGVISLAGLAAAISVRLKASVSQCFPLAAAGVIALEYAAGLCGVLYAGALTALVIGGIGGVYCALKSIKDGAAPRGLGTALLCWCVFFFIAFYANAQRMYAAWDEFSHWGLAARATWETRSLARGMDSVLTFADYPPATALFSYFISFCSHTFSEGATYVAMNMLMASVMMPLLTDLSVRHPLSLAAAAILGALLPALMLLGTYSEIYVDALLGVLTGMALCSYFIKERTRADELSFAAILFILVLTKPSGTGLAVITLLIALTDTVRARRLGTIVLGVCAVLAAKLSWSVYLSLCGQGASWNLGAIDLFNLGEMQKDVILRFFRAIEEETLFSYLIPVNFLMGIGIFALCAYLFTRLLDACRARVLKRAFTGAVLGAFVYALTLLLLYMYVYSPAEGLALASFARYMTTYLIALWLFLYALTLREGKDVRTRVLITAGIVLCTTGNAGKALYECASAPVRRANQAVYRQSYASVAQVAEQLKPGEKVFIASGLDSMAEWQVARYTALLPRGAVNTPQESVLGGEGAPEAQDLLEKLMEEYAYVYVCYADEAFWSRYGSCFAQGQGSYTLYRLDKEQGLLIAQQAP